MEIVCTPHTLFKVGLDFSNTNNYCFRNYQMLPCCNILLVDSSPSISIKELFCVPLCLSAFNSDVPVAPSSVRIWRSIQTRVVTILWNPPVQGHAEGSLSSFHMQYHAVSSPSIITMVTTFASNNSYELSNLTPYTYYSVKVAAVSTVGEGLWSKSVVFQTYSVCKWFSFYVCFLVLRALNTLLAN